MIKQKGRIMSLLAIVLFIALLYVYPALAKSIMDSASTFVILGAATTVNDIGPPNVNRGDAAKSSCTFNYDAVQETGSIKVTGGGEILVPDPNSNDADAIGKGKASFGFNAQTDKNGGMAKNNFNYVNHVTGLHVNGPVDKVVVIEKNPDGSPQIILFYGTSADCSSFIVAVKDSGEPGMNDQLGITVTGPQSETRSMRVVSNGNIQVHK